MKGRGGKSRRLFSNDMEKEEKLRWLVDGPHSQVLGRRSNTSVAFISPLLLLLGFEEKRCFFDSKTLQTCGRYQPAERPIPSSFTPVLSCCPRNAWGKLGGRERGKGESKLRFSACLASESCSSLINSSGRQARTPDWRDKWQEACRAGVCISVRVCRKIDLINVCVDWTLTCKHVSKLQCGYYFTNRLACLYIYIWVSDK